MKTVLLYLTCIFLFVCSPANAQMFWQQAASFNGNNHISVAPSSSLNLNGSFTLEAWIKPNSTSQLSIMGKQNTDYDLRLQGGRIALRSRSITRLFSKASTQIRTDVWTHVAGTYNSATNLFIIYINGFSDTSATIASAFPLGTSDSVFIGKGFNGGYNGLIDEARIWNRALTGSEIQNNMYTSLAVSGNSTNTYRGLILSITMQGPTSISGFTVNDFSPAANTVFNRNVTALNLTGKPSSTNEFNQCVDFNGTDGYIAGAGVPALQFTNAVTLQAWIRPADVSGTQVLISKGSTSDYGLWLTGNTICARINGSQINTFDTIPSQRWTHVAFSYNASDGRYKFYINGQLGSNGVSPLGNISVPNDSLFLGRSSTGQFFDGYMDEVRLCGTALPDSIIKLGFFRSYDAGDEPFDVAQNIVYNLDGYTFDNCENGGPRLAFRNGASFSTDYISPIDRFNPGFPNGFLLKRSNRKIPASSTSGLMVPDSLIVSGMPVIQDLNLFIALNHTFTSDLNVTLMAPNGDTAIVTLRDGRAFNGMITVFDDQADSSVANLTAPGTLVTFYTSVKPRQSFNSKFSGVNPNGIWKLIMSDNAVGDIGDLYMWGLQINNNVNVGVTQISNIIPQKFSLAQNYPNPFNPVTKIKFSIPETAPVSLKVYDIQGKEIAVMVNSRLEPGEYEAVFNGSTLSSGIYFYKLTSGDFTETRKMMIIK